MAWPGVLAGDFCGYVGTGYGLWGLLRSSDGRFNPSYFYILCDGGADSLRSLALIPRAVREL